MARLLRRGSLVLSSIVDGVAAAACYTGTGRRVCLGTTFSLPCDPVGHIHLWCCLESGFLGGGNARTGVLAQSRGSKLRFGVLWLGSLALY